VSEWDIPLKQLGYKKVKCGPFKTRYIVKHNYDINKSISKGISGGFVFEIGDHVEIIPIEMKGRVKAIYINAVGPTYMVRYFWECVERESYFYDDELRLKK